MASSNRYDQSDYDDYYGDYGAKAKEGYGHHSGYGHSDYGHESYCCPVVIDPLLFAALLAGIAGATAWLRPVIMMALGSRRRKRRHLPILYKWTLRE